MSEEGYIYISDGKPFEPGKRFIAPLGSYTLRRINAILAQRVREIQRNSLERIGEEDCIYSPPSL